MMLYLLKKVAVVSIFHHYTISQHLVRVKGVLPQAVARCVHEGLLVLYYVLVATPYGCEDADLIHGVLSLLLGQPLHLHLLQGVFALVVPPQHMIDCGVGALAQLLKDCEVFQRGCLVVVMVILVGRIPLRHVMHHYQLLLHFISRIIV